MKNYTEKQKKIVDSDVLPNDYVDIPEEDILRSKLNNLQRSNAIANQNIPTKEVIPRINKELVIKKQNKIRRVRLKLMDQVVDHTNSYVELGGDLLDPVNNKLAATMLQTIRQELGIFKQIDTLVEYLQDEKKSFEINTDEKAAKLEEQGVTDIEYEEYNPETAEQSEQELIQKMMEELNGIKNKHGESE